MMTCRKIELHALTGDFRTATRIVTMPLESPGPGQVLVRNRYAGVNAVFDKNLCRNAIRYIDVVPPFDMGIETVGEVVEIGRGVDGFAVGDPVATFKLGTGYREYQLAEPSRLIPVSSASPEILTLIPTGVSALVALDKIAGMRSGETIAISAAAGGLGHILVQLAKLAGNHVIGLTSSPRKAQLLEELGCDRIVDYRRESVRDVFSAEYPRGLDIAYDTVGGEIFEAFVDHLAMKGRLIVSGHTSDFDQPADPVPSVPVYRRLYWKSASIRAFQMPAFPEYFDEGERRILDLFAQGLIRPRPDTTPFR
ncbi:MAG TPA: zinc-binding dehydrogenase [Steroidobacteraceae bacterium]|nr:zinc-binding dehydrogenase [Steroidobacteraceae bacterium]